MMNYSIYIRTLGYGGEKYQRLLNSIDALTVRPAEVIVVLPHGYNPPKEQLGYEKFQYCPKGMIKQRIYAIDTCITEWILLLDDDVEFEPTLIEKFAAAAEAKGASVVMSRLTETGKASFARTVLDIITLNRLPVGQSVYYRSINKAGGVNYLTNIREGEIYLNQSGHGTHCFARTSALRNIHFEEDVWLEDAGYALPDDQVMFYKLYLAKNTIAVTTDTYFNHLDSRSTGGADRRNKLLYAKSRNYIIFWKKYIAPYQQTVVDKFIARLAITWRMLSEFLCLSIPMSVCYLKPSYFRNYLKGIVSGVKYKC